MDDRHRVSRAVHFPQSFPNKSFDRTTLLTFRADDAEKDNPNRTYKMSVVCRCIMPDDADVHAYGIRIESKQNAKLEADLGEPPPQEKRRVYLGFYDILYDVLAALVFEHYRVSVVWVLEDGEMAHLEVHFRSLGNEATDKRRRADRSAALKSLADRIVGPTIRPGLTDPFQLEMQSQLPSLGLTAAAA